MTVICVEGSSVHPPREGFREIRVSVSDTEKRDLGAPTTEGVSAVTGVSAVDDRTTITALCKTPGEHLVHVAFPLLCEQHSMMHP